MGSKRLNSARVDYLAERKEILSQTFKLFRPEITKQIAELKKVKWDIRDIVEPYLDKLSALHDAYKKALVRSVISKTDTSKADAKAAFDAFCNEQENRPFLMDLFFYSHAVKHQLGNRCAADVADAMNKFEVPGASDIVSRKQASSLMNLTRALTGQQKPEYSERESILFRFYMACRHIIAANPSDPRYQLELISNKRQGGNFLEQLSNFAQKKNTLKILRLMENAHRYSGKKELSNEEIIIAALHGFEYTTALIQSLANRKAYFVQNGSTFEFDHEVKVFKRKIGQKLKDDESISGGPLTYFF